MNHRERTMAVLNYQNYDRLPIVHFGFWTETLQKWAEEGHLTRMEADGWADGNPYDIAISKKLGFDFNWGSAFHWKTGPFPEFKREILEESPDGTIKLINEDGAIVLEKRGVVSIPIEVDHLLKTRNDWETIFKPRLQFSMDRILTADVNYEDQSLPFEKGGADFLKKTDREKPFGLFCGSMLGWIRNWLGLVGLSYMMTDNEDLLDEIIETVGELNYQAVKTILEMDVCFDYAHFWEDICFKNGPLVSPRWFDRKIGPQYKRLTDLLNQHGIHIVSLDCDGCIDRLIPTWFTNGINTMFPIEVGTWNASIQPWREKYGRELRGVGGMNKVVFAYDRARIDAEIERMRPLVDLGGFIPCPDHRIPPDAKWENVQYYCDRMYQVFG
jgi:uroporphyrinogen decarboxylase